MQSIIQKYRRKFLKRNKNIMKMRNFLNERLNLFDRLLIIGCLLLLGVLIFSKFSRKTEVVTIRIKITNDEWWWEGNPPTYWMLEGLSIGQEAYNSFGKRVAEIVDIHSVDTWGDKKEIFVDVNLLSSYNKRLKIYNYNFQPLQIGKPIDLVFGKSNVRGIIAYIGVDDIVYEEKEIEIKMLSVFPWEVDSYKIGLETKDTEGRVVVKIIEVRVENAQGFYLPEQRETGGNFYMRRLIVGGEDLSRKDMTLRLRIKTIVQDGVSYFIDGSTVRVGNEIWFHFPEVVIKSGVISKIFY